MSDQAGLGMEFDRAVDVLCQSHLGHIIEEWFIERVQQDLRQNVAPVFWQAAKATADTDPILCLSEAVGTLHKELSQYKACVERLESIRPLLGQQPFGQHFGKSLPQNQRQLKKFLFMLYKAVIFHSIPKYFHTVINSFYSKAFKVFHLTKLENEGKLMC